MQIYVDVQVNSEQNNIPTEEQFKDWIETAVKDEMQIAELCVRIVDIEEMSDLNQQYRKKAGPTNVLAFPAQVPSELNLNILGDIIICAPVVEQEAASQQKELLHHWAHLTTHGVLHLLGYDHQSDEEADIMENKETTLMTNQGYPDPYAIEKEISK